MNEWTCEPYGNRSYRQVTMTYLHYKDNGDMVDDLNFLQESSVAKEGKYYKTGVGNYDAGCEQIESEWFFKRAGALIKKECLSGGFEIQNIKNGDYLNFPNIKNLEANSTISFRVSSAHAKGGTIEIRKDSETGKLLGVCNVLGTGSVSTYKTVSCKLKNIQGLANLYLVFKGGEGELMRLDWFSFK